MKKTNSIFKGIIAIAAIAIFVSCKKEIVPAQNKATGVAQATDFSSMTKNPDYPWPDSTKTTKTVGTKPN